jgi:hypothetical protein
LGIGILFSESAFAVGTAYSGSWYNPEESGHGFSFEYGEFDTSMTVRPYAGVGVFTFENPEMGEFSYEPSAWMIEEYGVSPVITPIVKLLEVGHPNPEVITIEVEKEGPKGDAGPKGDTGSKGDTGPRGEAGPKGESGNSNWGLTEPSLTGWPSRLSTLN